MRATAYLEIPTDGGEFSALELQTSLAYFRGLYVYAMKSLLTPVGVWPEYQNEFLDNAAFDGKLTELFDARPSRFQCYSAAEDISRHLYEQDDYALEMILRYGIEQIEDQFDLTISELNRANPVKIVVSGVFIILSVAVVLSGGTLKASNKGLEVQLPPIGDGITKLREALRPLPPREIGQLKDVTPEIEVVAPKKIRAKTTQITQATRKTLPPIEH
jgi:hypothetical protein